MPAAPLPPFRLYLVFLADCETCAKTKPEVEAWLAEHPWIKFIPFDFEKEEWRADSWHPKMVPTLVILRPDGKWFYREGGATQTEINTWIRKVAPGALKTPRAAESVVESK